MTLERFFYHNVGGKCCKPTIYGKSVMEFPSIIDAKNYIYETYRNGYTIEEVDGTVINLFATNGLVCIKCFLTY